jgi:hypothetical protein
MPHLKKILIKLKYKRTHKFCSNDIKLRKILAVLAKMFKKMLLESI